MVRQSQQKGKIMLSNIQLTLVLLLLVFMTTSNASAHADAPPSAGQTLTLSQSMYDLPGVVYRKTLPEGRTLSVSRIKLPPNPKTIKDIDDFDKAAKATKGFPPGGTILYPNYSWLYSFEVTGGKAKPVILWTLRADHLLNPLVNGENIEMDWSFVRVKDAVLEGQVLVLVFKQAGDTYGFIILPDAKHGPQRLPRSGPSFRLAVDKDDEHGRVFTQTAQITGSYLKGTLAVDLTFTDGTKEGFDWKGDAWVKEAALLPALPPALSPLNPSPP
jgi:hypothetical protein